MNERTPEHHEDRPHIDVSPALGEGGSEVEQLGYEGVPDTGPVLGKDVENAPDLDDVADLALDSFPPD